LIPKVNVQIPPSQADAVEMFSERRDEENLFLYPCAKRKIAAKLSSSLLYCWQ